MEVNNEGSAGGGVGEAGGSTTALPRGSFPCSELCFAVSACCNAQTATRCSCAGRR